MGAPYAQDLRDRVLAAYDRGMPTKQIADVFQVSPAWARRVKQRRRETGETTPRPMGGVRIVKVELSRLATLVRAHPDATTRELHQMLDVDCAESTVGMALRRAQLTFKKRQFMLRSRTGRTSRTGASCGKRGGPASPPVG